MSAPRPVYVCPHCKTRIPFGTTTVPPASECPGCRRQLGIPTTLTLGDFVRMQLEHKFGPLSNAVLAQIEALPVERLNKILLAIPDAKSLDELGLTA